jgi:hypothetical protein
MIERAVASLVLETLSLSLSLFPLDLLVRGLAAHIP